MLRVPVALIILSCFLLVHIDKFHSYLVAYSVCSKDSLGRTILGRIQ